MNCLGTSVYVIVSKRLLQRYMPLCVTAWSYLLASLVILTLLCVINETPSLLSFFCSDDDLHMQQTCVAAAWSVPTLMILPLVYWVVFNSILAYALMTWANQYAQASVVSIYTVLQPFTSGTISAVLVAARGRAWAEAYGLEAPGVQDLGLLGVGLGLYLLFSDNNTSIQSPVRDPHKRQALAESAATGLVGSE